MNWNAPNSRLMEPSLDRDPAYHAPQSREGTAVADWSRSGVMLDSHQLRQAIAPLLIAVITTLPCLALAEGAMADPSPATRALERAFDNRYGMDLTQRVHLTVRNSAGAERRRVVEMAMKRIDGRLHSLGRFTYPEYLRGTTLLVIENSDRSDDHFVYLPSQRRVRRIASSRRADSFMGTDLTYEDFERRYVGDYAIERQTQAVLAEEPVFVIATRPRFDSAYERTEFYIAQSDFAILEIRYYQGDLEHPTKTLYTPRSGTRKIGGHVIATVMRMENLHRRTETEVRFEQITVNPELEEELFASTALESGRPIPGLLPKGAEEKPGAPSAGDREVR